MKIYTPDQEPKNFTLVLYKDGFNKKDIDFRIETRSKRRFVNKLNSLPENFYAYLRVSYINSGSNWGDYETKKNLIKTFRSFIWEEID